jgi:hypothetical protein
MVDPATLNAILNRLRAYLDKVAVLNLAATSGRTPWLFMFPGAGFWARRVYQAGLS